MIVLIGKKLVNGRYVDFNVSEIFTQGQILHDTENSEKRYIVTSIHGAKINIEEVVQDDNNTTE